MQKGYTVRVAWDDTDCTRRIYLGKYIKWVDDACTEYLRDRGLTFDQEGWLSLNGKELNESFVVGEYSMRMEKVSGFDEVLTVRISVKEMRRRVIVFKGEIFDGKGDMCAHGTLTYIYIKRGTKSTDIPEHIAKLLPVSK